MWPCGDTMRHISHLGVLFPRAEGFACVSRGYHHALMYPPLAIVAKVGNNPPRSFCQKLSIFLGREPIYTSHSVVFSCCRGFCDLCRSCKLSLYVRGQCQRPDTITLQQKDGQFVLMFHAAV